MTETATAKSPLVEQTVEQPAPSVWSPLRIGIFRAIWLAGLASNVGSWMHLVAARAAAAELARARRRAGAMQWTLYADIRDPQRQVETVTVPSWSEHLRQGERETEADRTIAERVLAFHGDSEHPRERALLSEHRHRSRRRGVEPKTMIEEGQS